MMKEEEEEVNCMNMMKEEEGVGRDVGLPSCQICQFLALGVLTHRIVQAYFAAVVFSKGSSFSRG